MFWTAAMFLMIVATIGETASISPTATIDREIIDIPNLNEARSKVSVSGSLALELFEYLLYQYKTKSDIIQKRMSGMLHRFVPSLSHNIDNNELWEKRENAFDGFAIATGVSLLLVVIAIVFQPLAGVTSRFTRRLNTARQQLDSEKILQLTETVFQSIENFQKKINNS